MLPPGGPSIQPHVVFTMAVDGREGVQGHVPTALAALTVDDAERLCDRLNARLEHTREDWTAFAARSMRAGDPGDRRRLPALRTTADFVERIPPRRELFPATS